MAVSARMLGSRLKEIRITKGISGKFVSEKLGIDPSTLSKYESGDRKIDGDILPEYAEALGVTVGYIFKENVDETPTKLTSTA